MAQSNATDRMQRELNRAVEALREDLDRVELLTAALAAFSRPVPDYEPSFRHVHAGPLTDHELGAPVRD